MPYFTVEELNCNATGKIVLAEGFADRLILLRNRFGKPMMVSSCCRSAEYNKKIGGEPDSFHIYDMERHGFIGTCAADVDIDDHTEKGELFALAWQLGWSVGFNNNFLHLDRRSDYTDLKQVVFGYGKPHN